MRRTIAVWAIPVAVLATAVAMATSSTAALAALPEFRACFKVVRPNVGRFEDKLCSQPGDGSGRWELGAWNQGTKTTFRGKIGASTLHSYIPAIELTPWLGGTIASSVQCKAGRVKGELTGPKTSTLTIELRACTSEGKKCSSPEATKGVIKTRQLTATLGYILGGVGIDVEASDHGAYAEFGCEGINVVTRGSQIGVVTDNVDHVSKEADETFTTNANAGQEIVSGLLGEFPLDPETGIVHYLRSTITPPGIALPTSGSVTALLRGGALEVAA